MKAAPFVSYGPEEMDAAVGRMLRALEEAPYSSSAANHVHIHHQLRDELVHLLSWLPVATVDQVK